MPMRAPRPWKAEAPMTPAHMRAAPPMMVEAQAASCHHSMPPTR